MKIVVTGSLGNVSKPLSQELISKGNTVTIISSDAGKRQEIEDSGAGAAIGSVTDSAFLQSVFANADAVYAMIPPNYATPDSLAHYRQVAGSYAAALTGSDVRKVVHLSSWGADLGEGTGYIQGSHFAEYILNNVPGISVTHLRAGFIYYNLFHFIGMIKTAGSIFSNYGENDKIVMVSPLDIAAAVAGELLSDENGNKVRYIASDDRSAADVARALGMAIGKPDLQWKILPTNEVRRNMERNGVPDHVIANTLELGNSIHTGNLRRHYDQTAPHIPGRVKIEDFAREFAAVYHKM